MRIDVLPDAPFFPNRNHDLARRSAILLSWAAEVRPGALVPYAEITQRILRLNMPLAPDDPLTLVVRDHVQCCGSILFDEFARDLVFNSVGARATVGAEELFLQFGRDLDHSLAGVEQCQRRIRLISRQRDADNELLCHLHSASLMAKSAARPICDLLSTWSTLAAERANSIAGEPAEDGDEGDAGDDAADHRQADVRQASALG